MWNLVDERRKINASISHDLRTPITVIKGYSEYLDKNTGKGTLTERGIREIAVCIHQAAGRLEEYADSVHEVQALEDLRLEYQEVSLSDFEVEMVSQLSVIDKQTTKKNMCIVRASTANCRSFYGSGIPYHRKYDFECPAIL